jgi:hypothetical protein
MVSIEILAFDDSHPMGECATHPIARLARRLAALRINAGSDHAASSRLARQRARRTLGRVQLRFLGSILAARVKIALRPLLSQLNLFDSRCWWNVRLFNEY